MIDKGWHKEYGARPLKRAIQKHVEDVLAEYMLQTDLQANDTLVVDVDADKAIIQIQVEEKVAQEECKEELAEV